MTVIELKTFSKRKTNKELREREYLTEEEVKSLIIAARKHSRAPDRDEALILMMYRHGLRVKEAMYLKWEQIDLKTALIHVNRVKKGLASTHPLSGTELRVLRKLYREESRGSYVFLSNRKAPFTSQGINKIVKNAGINAGIPFPIHPHMLRHGTGYHLANQGLDTRKIQLYMGHANIQNTMIYTQISSKNFKNYWGD